MNVFIKLLLPVLLIAILSFGCAHYSNDPSALTALSIQDLEKARALGKEEISPLPYDTAFDKVMEILKSEGLTIFQRSKEKRFIIAMGFPKQTDTTRVGIFFETLPDKRTKITLSSLSSTALKKAKTIIFGNLNKR